MCIPLTIAAFCAANPRTFNIDGLPKETVSWTEGDIVIMKSEPNEEAVKYTVSTVAPLNNKIQIFLRSSAMNYVIEQDEKGACTSKTATADELFRVRLEQTDKRAPKYQKGCEVNIFGATWFLEKAEIPGRSRSFGMQEFRKPGNIFYENRVDFYAEKLESPSTSESAIRKKYYWGRIAATTAVTLGCTYLAYKKLWAKN